MKKFVSVAILISIVFVLDGCATGYRPDGLGGGYSEMALNQDTYIVAFRGNGFTSDGRVESYLLRRCAELTLKKGYKYFIVTKSNTSNDKEIVQTPTTVNVNSYGNYQGYGSENTNYFGNSAFNSFNMMGNSHSSTHATINHGTQYQVNRFTSRAIVKMFKSNKNLQNAFDAKVILSNFQDNR